MDIHIEGQHASIEDMEWKNVPNLAVITGLNGAGKTQLLEVLANSLAALQSTRAIRAPIGIRASAQFIGETFRRGEVFHSYGEWLPLEESFATEDQVEEAVQEFQSRRRKKNLLGILAKQLKVNSDRLRILTPTQFVSVLTPSVLWTHTLERFQNLSFLFFAYRYFEKIARTNGESPGAILRRFGEPPWNLLSAVIEASGLQFRVNYPPELSADFGGSDRFDFKLYDFANTVVPLRGLSSGERVMMSTAMWRYQSEVAGRQHKLLLLDEPDAHLHPSLARRFLNVISTVFVNQRGVRVILTTHSPSTVALAPAESLYEMDRSTHRLRKVERAEAIAKLTGGFVAVQDATRTVLLEGKDDPAFYRIVWQLLIERRTPGEPSRLEPYPNISFVHGQGRQTVQELVPQLRASGFTNFFGIIDMDSGNRGKSGVQVLGRYAIENYIYDPISIWFHLKRTGHDLAFSNDASLLTISPQQATSKQLQAILDCVVGEIECHFPSKGIEETSRVFIAFGNIKLAYPAWCLTRRKSEIRDQYNRVFSQFRREDLLTSYTEVNLIPDELIDLLRSIQQSG